MASRIKGITVEIGGDTTGLEKALKSVNSSIKTTQSELKDVNKLLKLDPSNTELLTQKQKLLKDAISSTKEKLDTLKTAQEQAKAQLENGDLGVLIYGDEGEGTLKRYIQRGNCVVLQPFNPAYSEMVIKGEDLNHLHIAGRVVETKAKW